MAGSDTARGVRRGALPPERRLGGRLQYSVRRSGPAGPSSTSGTSGASCSRARASPATASRARPIGCPGPKGDQSGSTGSSREASVDLISRGAFNDAVEWRAWPGKLLRSLYTLIADWDGDDIAVSRDAETVTIRVTLDGSYQSMWVSSGGLSLDLTLALDSETYELEGLHLEIQVDPQGPVLRHLRGGGAEDRNGHKSRRPGRHHSGQCPGRIAPGALLRTCPADHPGIRKAAGAMAVSRQRELDGPALTGRHADHGRAVRDGLAHGRPAASHDGRHASVHVDRRAGDVGRPPGDQKRYEVGRLLRLANAAERHP